MAVLTSMIGARFLAVSFVALPVSLVLTMLNIHMCKVHMYITNCIYVHINCKHNTPMVQKAAAKKGGLFKILE